MDGRRTATRTGVSRSSSGTSCFTEVPLLREPPGTVMSSGVWVPGAASSLFLQKLLVVGGLGAWVYWSPGPQQLLVAVAAGTHVLGVDRAWVHSSWEGSHVG